MQANDAAQVGLLAAATFGLLVGCGSGPPSSSTSPAPAPSPPRASAPQVDEAKAALKALVTRAEQSLVDDLKLDYERPFVKKSLERPETVELLLEACRKGHRRSCWKAAIIAPLEDQARHYEQVAANCRAGHRLSCRALPSQMGIAEPAYTDLPGVLSRSECDPSCDPAALKHECDEGFAQACYLAHMLLSSSEASERKQLMAQESKLAAEDCAAGIEMGCSRLTLYEAPSVEKLSAMQQYCVLERGACPILRALYDELKQPTEARDSLERSCQYGKNPKVCAVLGAAYVDHIYEEPVPGRGQALIDDGCRKLGTYAANVVECKRATSVNTTLPR